MATKSEFDYPRIKALHVLRYYVNYMDFEKPLLDALENSNEIDESVLNLFKRYKNTYMSVGRNFKSEMDSEILRILNEFVTMKEYDPQALSERLFQNKLLNEKIKNAISASSKFLWLYNHKVIIIDSLNMAALKSRYNDYPDFCEKWNKVYELKSKEIKEVINTKKLIEIDDVMGNEWFHRRVFDQYLMGL